jgi:alkylation response protein AidB-like acyl-CoA dehydrogenase
MTNSPDLGSFRAFFLGELEGRTDEIARCGRLPAGLMARAAEIGALAMTAPRDLGGLGLPVRQFLPFLEVAAQGPAVGRMLVHVANGLWRPIAKHGSPAQQELISSAGRGEVVIALGVTEPGGGSGKDLRSIAVPSEADTWRLSGEKHLITWAQHADWFIILAGAGAGAGPGAGPGAGGPGGTEAGPKLTTFLVPRSAPGLTVEAQTLMGLDGTGVGRVVMHDVEVGRADLLGGVGEGMTVLATFLDYSRISLSCCMVGVGQRALDEAVRFARERVTFGKPLGERQAIQTKLADMYAKLAAARALTESLATQYDEGTVRDVDTAAAKMFCAEAVNDITDTALRIHGGLGYTTARPIERIYRDARAFLFEEGTAEIQQLMIARRLLRG